MQLTRVAVLRGGPSTEYEVSMMTGHSVLEALRELPYAVKDVVIDQKGEWIVGGYVKTPEQALLDIDVVFIALHGAYGEDGTVQRILHRLHIPYTGSGPYASAIALNKHLTKEHLKQLGVKMPKHLKLTSTGIANVQQTAESLKRLFGPQYVIKPIAGGSSIGTIMVERQYELASALQAALADSPEIIVEERVIGKEATVGILERFRGQLYYQLPAIEIIPPAKTPFFSADVKYTGETDEICPGRFSKTEKQELAAVAELVHRSLNLQQYSRSDFIVAQDGVYFLEVNTLPGLTSQSLYPKAVAAVGSCYRELIDFLIRTARV